MSGSLLVVSGPSGSGKSSLCREICAAFDFVRLSVSTTTRAPRTGEEEGKDYFFTAKESFEAAIERGEFLEWARVHDNLYGTSKLWVEEQLAANKTVVFDIDVQGQASIVKLFPNLATSVFITTPNIAILKERLIKRGLDGAEAIARRLENAVGEMFCLDRYDYLLINDRFEESLSALKAIALASRYKRGGGTIRDLISEWKKGD